MKIFMLCGDKGDTVMANSTLATYLEENPKMIGVLFTMFLLLTQAGNSSAAAVATMTGP